MDSYSKIPKTLLELKLIGPSTLQVVNANNDSPVEEAIQLFNAAIGGLFDVRKSHNDRWTIQLAGETMKSFNIILTIKNQCQFRLFTGPTALFCSLIQNHLQFKNSTALMLLLETSAKLDIDVCMLGKEYRSIHWTPSSFNVTESLNMENADEFDELAPQMLHRCPDCLLITPNGEGHTNPCPPRHTISVPRENIFSKTMTTVFKIRLANPSYVLKVMNSETNMFMDVSSGLSLFNDIIEGVFSFKTFDSGSTVMTFEATSIKRFSIIFAVFIRNSWRLRLRLVITLKTGIIGFPLTKILYVDNGRIEIPKEYRTNTVLFFGIHATDDIQLAVRVFANSSGLNILGPNGEFRGYFGEIKWDRNNDSISLPDEFLPSKAKRVQFSSHLYRANGQQKPIAEAWRQKFVKEPNLNKQHQEMNARVEGKPMTMRLPAPASSTVIDKQQHETKEKTEEKFEDVHKQLNVKVYNDFVYWRPPIMNIELGNISVVDKASDPQRDELPRSARNELLQHSDESSDENVKLVIQPSSARSNISFGTMTYENIVRSTIYEKVRATITEFPFYNDCKFLRN